MPSASFPDDLTVRAFTRREARDLGVSNGSIQRQGLVRVTHGVHAVAGVEEGSRRAALLLGLPRGSAFSHTSAAALHDMPLTPRQLQRAGDEVMCPSGRGPIRRSGVRGHRGLESRAVTCRDGLPVVDAADTWCDFGELVRRDGLSVDDLVVLGDAATNVVLRPERTAYDFEGIWPEPWATTTLTERLEAQERRDLLARAELFRRLDARCRPRGKRVLELALPLIRSKVRSPTESRARLTFHWAGFPEPVVNLDIYAADGHWVAEGDLVWPEQMVIGEYQGAHHAERARASADADRRQRLDDHGWRTREIWAEDLFDRERRMAMLTRFDALLS